MDLYIIKKKHIIILCGLVIVLPLILQYAIFANSIESNASNDGWASFLGSYIGGVFGGGMTLAAVLISVRETRRIQEENKEESSKRVAEATFRDSARIKKIQRGNEVLQKRKERIEFCNNVAELVGRYCADISKYFYDCKLKTGNANRIISIECFFILSIKLKNIDAAKNLVKELTDLHSMVMHENTTADNLDKAVHNLMAKTNEFISNYVDDVN